MSEGSDSTNYLTSVSVERYNNRPASATNRSTKIDTNNHHHHHHHTSKYAPSPAQEKRSVEWDEENIQQNEGRFQTKIFH
jgi:hypothetical protein